MLICYFNKLGIRISLYSMLRSTIHFVAKAQIICDKNYDLCQTRADTWNVQMDLMQSSFSSSFGFRIQAV